MIVVPEAFAAGIQAREGEPGRIWLAALPGIVAGLCRRWNLTIDGPPWHGHLAVVVPCQRGTQPCALKLSWRDVATVHETHALRIWNGNGTVRLLESAPDHGALLLERLDAERTLASVPLDRAIGIAGEIIRRLSIPSDATPPTVDSLAEGIATSLADRWERLRRPVPEPLLTQAIDNAISLSDPFARSMVNWDLHHGNVLYSPTRREWLAIDPKPATGAPEFGIAQLLWTRIDEMSSPTDLNRHLATLIDAAGLDSALTRAWTLVRVVDYWLWALSIGLTEDPRRCATLIKWLEG